jgi:N-ethylmaleimide reductase
VQIHGANGYLVDQFLRDGANFRDDEYGGSIENRVRFMTEVLEAAGAAIGMDRVGIRFSPNIFSQGVEDSDPLPLFEAVARRLEELRVPWIELREPLPGQPGPQPTERVSPAMRKLYSGKIFLNGGFEPDSAREFMAEGVADGISFGRPFISNPDLVRRIAEGAPLNAGDVGTFYAGGANGYVDYPTLEESAAA